MTNVECGMRNAELWNRFALSFVLTNMVDSDCTHKSSIDNHKNSLRTINRQHSLIIHSTFDISHSYGSTFFIRQ
jgi:hypothetical protein